MESIKYNEIIYWNKRTHPNSEINAQLSKEEFFLINKYARGNILEYGCGVGRCFSAYTNTDFVIGIDISSMYKKRAIIEAKKYKLNFNHYIIKSSLDINFNNDEFDVVFAIKVLQHVKPKYIHDVVKKLSDISSVAVFYNGVFGNDLAAHCFSHDYELIIKDLGLNIIESNKRYYVVKKNSLRNS